jgi:hypothetical protein
MKHEETIQTRDQLVRQLPDASEIVRVRCCTGGSFIAGVVRSVGAEKAIASGF